MGKQSSLFDNSVRVTPLETKEINSIRIKEDESKEYATALGKVVIVTKKVGFLQGVSTKKQTYFQISTDGKVLQPFQAIGVKNYLKRN